MKKRMPKQYFGLPSLKKLAGFEMVHIYEDHISSFVYFAGYAGQLESPDVLVRVPHVSLVLAPSLAEIIPQEIVSGDEIVSLVFKKRKALRR